MIDLFRYKSLRYYTLLQFLQWFMRFFVYYTITFSIEQYGTSINFNFSILGFAEVLAAFVTMPMKIKYKRIFLFKSCAIALIILPLLLFIVKIPDQCYIEASMCYQEILTIFIAFLLKFSITFFAVILITYTSEFYPTTLRSQGYGMCMTIGHIASICAPLYVEYITIKTTIHPLISISVCAFLNYLVTLCQKETLG